MSNSLNQTPAIVNTSMAAASQIAPGVSRINVIWVWGAATDTFTLQDGNGNTILVGIATAGQTTGMWACPVTLTCVNGFKVSAITVSGAGGLYIFSAV